MNNNEGLKLQINDLVWTTDFFENLFTPYKVVHEPYQDGKNVFVRILPVFSVEDGSVPSERMNVTFISKTHPRGWKITKEDGTPITVNNITSNL